MTNASAAEFERELKVFERQAGELAQFVFAQMAINHVARRNQRTNRAMNITPMFWNTVVGALQYSAIVAVGRLFDPRSLHNVDRLLRLADQNRHVFSRQALAARKRHGSANADEWLPDYLTGFRVPTTSDFRRLRRVVNKHHAIYQSQFRDIRHKYFAHTEVVDATEVSMMFAKTRIRDLEQLAAAMNQIHDAVWETFYNGRRRLRFRPAASSARNLVRRKLDDTRDRTPQERIVLEVKHCLRLLAAAASGRLRRERPMSAKSRLNARARNTRLNG